MRWSSWRPYVPVAARRANALKEMSKLRKKGVAVQPVEIEGRKIARTFWGEAWCDHLESFSDYENRLPRGRTYVRNGSVCHLEVSRGQVRAMVSGSELYEVKIGIKQLKRKQWNGVKSRCAGQIASLLELLQGKFSRNVMSVVTDRENGLFPRPPEIDLKCDCLDWAEMCKHVAAVLYGVGARLDENPELLFLLRGVDQEELIGANVDVTVPGAAGRKRIADDALADVFGIELSEDPPSKPENASPRKMDPAKRSRIPRMSAENRPAAHGKKRRGGKPAAPMTPRPKSAGTSRGRSASKNKALTGKAVVLLRAKFGMSKSQFAELLGVTTSTIANWEKRPGKLNPRPRTLAAWNAVRGLSKARAQRALNGC